jgi:hypothetical protein
VAASFAVQSMPQAGGTIARMVAKDLSLCGLRCSSTSDYPEMTRLAVRLLLPLAGSDQAVPVDVEAVVVRREPVTSAAAGEPRFELALFFTRVDDTARRQLATFVGG